MDSRRLMTSQSYVDSLSHIFSLDRFPHTSHQMSIFLSSLPPDATEESIKTRVVLSIPAVEPPKIRSVVHVAKSRYVESICIYRIMSLTSRNLQSDCRCAFVNFKDRASAELAAQAWASGLDIDGTRVNVKWGRSKTARAGGDSGTASSSSASTAGPSTYPVNIWSLEGLERWSGF